MEEFLVPIQVRAEQVSGAWRGVIEAPGLFPLNSPVALPRSPARFPFVARGERGTPRAFTLTATPDRNLIERRGCGEWPGVLTILRFTGNKVLEFSLMDQRREDLESGISGREQGPGNAQIAVNAGCQKELEL